MKHTPGRELDGIDRAAAGRDFANLEDCVNHLAAHHKRTEIQIFWKWCHGLARMPGTPGPLEYVHAGSCLAHSARHISPLNPPQITPTVFFGLTPLV